ncbi:DUF2238 domain-containing protein [Neptunicella sp. SCSIO 80796]|uniref:DUF2238 domain-containing protein n=1 Tax=Neptunicella plasticusilytica TaxID=3117012 RepID=UPI003A4E1BB0
MLTKGSLFWLLAYFSVLVWSAIAPKDLFTWFLEVVPALIGLVLLVLTRKSFPLTTLLYILLLLHCIILMVGGHYTYAEVPLFEHIKHWLDLERNNYDKLAYFIQGFVPAILAREILIRKQVVSSNAWRNLFIVSICLAFSALYELIEWQVAVATGESAEAFLGTQGYMWDTQSDMALALIGALCALLTLSHWHNRQLIHCHTHT